VRTDQLLNNPNDLNEVRSTVRYTKSFLLTAIAAICLTVSACSARNDETVNTTEDMQLLHMDAAHTDGDGVVWFRGSNTIHTGDVFINGIYPLADPDSGGSFDGIISAAETILAMIDDETQIIPGHGPVTGKAGLQAYRDMCIALQKKIAGMKKSGMSL
jgi:hypothetical protein